MKAKIRGFPNAPPAVAAVRVRGGCRGLTQAPKQGSRQRPAPLYPTRRTENSREWNAKGRGWPSPSFLPCLGACVKPPQSSSAPRFARPTPTRIFRTDRGATGGGSTEGGPRSVPSRGAIAMTLKCQLRLNAHFSLCPFLVFACESPAGNREI